MFTIWLFRYRDLLTAVNRFNLGYLVSCPAANQAGWTTPGGTERRLSLIAVFQTALLSVYPVQLTHAGTLSIASLADMGMKTKTP